MAEQKKTKTKSSKAEIAPKKAVEPVKEETKEVEKPKTKISLNLDILHKKEPEPEIIKLGKESPTKLFHEVIEEERHGLFAMYKKTNRWNTILLVVTVAIFVAAFFMLTQQGWGQYVAWPLIGVTLVGLFIYYIFTRRLYPNASKKYFHTFWKAINEYTFEDKNFTDCKIDANEKYVLADILTDRVYKDVIDFASRNIVRGFYKKKEFELGELAFYKPGAKRKSREVIFVGRHISFKNDFEFEGRYIITISGVNKIDLPNDLGDVTELKSQNNFTIYGPEGKNAEKVLGKHLIDSLKTIECTGCLLNVNVVIWGGHTAVYLSYDDSIVAIPFEKEINLEAYKQYKRNVLDIFQIFLGK